MFLFTPQRPEEEEFPNGAEVATACTFIVYFVNLFTLDFTNLYCWLVIIVLKSLTFLWGYIFLPTISSTDLFSESSHTMIQLSMLHVQQGALCLSRALQRSIVNLCAADVFEHTLSVLHKRSRVVAGWFAYSSSCCFNFRLRPVLYKMSPLNREECLTSSYLGLLVRPRLQKDADDAMWGSVRGSIIRAYWSGFNCFVHSGY